MKWEFEILPERDMTSLLSAVGDPKQPYAPNESYTDRYCDKRTAKSEVIQIS